MHYLCKTKSEIMKLEIRHLAPYLPYGLSIDTSHWDNEPSPIGKNIVAGIRGEDFICQYGWASTHGRMIEQEYSIYESKPILRPLSDLTKEIEHNGELFIPLYKLIKEDKAFTTDFSFGYKELKVSVYEFLLEWHFDVFNLREHNLCIYYNEL